MVHRPADSRLLSNLLAHEKDYSKHLSILLDYSQASLASFSAYASASAPPTSQVIVAVAGTLAGADEALRKYAVSVDRWQEQLKTLKDLEDDVGNVMRDREILVTRLIKASKSQKPSRDSFLGGGSPSGSLMSFPKPEVQVGSKLTTAQAELQACEAHLANKERELDALRSGAIKSGLQTRCKALVECGWAWGEMGKEGLRALEILDMPNGHGPPRPLLSRRPKLDMVKPPGVVTHPRSSQLLRSPTHSKSPLHTRSPISPVPNGMAQPRISEDDTGPGSSAEEEDVGPVEVHENERFASGGRAKAKVETVSRPRSRHVSFSLRGSRGPAGSDESSFSRAESPTATKGKSRQRSGSVFGSIAALFHRGGSHSDAEAASSSPAKSSGRWRTRVDKNVALVKRGGDSSDDESGRLASDYAALSHSYAREAQLSASASMPLSEPGAAGSNGTPQLRKRISKRSSVRVQPTMQMEKFPDKGYVSDGGEASGSKGTGKTLQKLPLPVDLGVNGDAAPPTSTATTSKIVKPKRPAAKAVQGPTVDASLSRNSSMSKQSVFSAVSAPARTNTAHAHIASPLIRSNSLPRKRAGSLEITQTPSKGGVSVGTRHKRVMSASGPPATRSGLTNGEPSLMSIVEDLARQNREAWARQDPNRMLVLPKAPPPISVTSGNVAGVGTSPRHTQAKDNVHAKETSRRSLTLPVSASAPSLPISISKPLPPKMPLRSALRNPSRTPSPNPPPALSGAAPIMIAAKSPTPLPSSKAQQEDDVSSTSSYETGHEAFDDEEELPPPPPPHDMHVPATSSDLSHSTDSTTTAPIRRKSVRMSLPPTFASTPPAFDDDDEQKRRRHHPWTPSRANGAHPQGWATKIEGSSTRDLWQNSSDEEEEYSKAKTLLAKTPEKF
ncbi:hypothetical protein A0H81_06762 [Grifola frondosa]|uniref:Uncharacterized protein n=1 Tax=Grifola frondosa TaxID=5627 RepID=A0A1C7M8V7_GRIFR|nr:hypothetical protein A0H81_06762 [Grifola frondosa]